MTALTTPTAATFGRMLSEGGREAITIYFDTVYIIAGKFILNTFIETTFFIGVDKVKSKSLATVIL